MAEVSIVIPTYNRADLLPRAIGSVLNQTFEDFELIVVDDGSTDSTRELVEDFCRADSRIRYIHQENSGSPASPRNVGIRQATGRFIAFLDHDDEWLPAKLERQRSLLINASATVGFIGCNILIVDSAERKGLRVHDLNNYMGEGFVKGVLAYNFVLTASAVIARKEVFETVGGFDIALKIGDDLDMWLRMSDKFGFDFVRDALVKYYVHKGNASRSQDSAEATFELEKIFVKHKSIYERYPDVHRRILRQLGSKFCSLGEAKRGRGYYTELIRSGGGSVETLLLYLSSFVLGKDVYRFVNDHKRKSQDTRAV